MQLFEGILFSKGTNNTKTKKQLLPVGFFQKDVCTRLCDWDVSTNGPTAAALLGLF